MKRMLKLVAQLVSKLLVLPIVWAYRWGMPLVGAEKAFAGGSQMMSLLPGLCGVYLRRAFYQMVLPRCGHGSCISFGTIFSHPTACVGRDVYIGAFCVLGSVSLEDDVLIGSHASIMNGSRQHGTQRLDIPVREQPGEWPHITIGQDTWIGDRAVVMSDVGRHCVVAAGAVVTKRVPDYAIAAGVPAKIIGWRDNRQAAIEPATGERVASLASIEA